MHKPEIIVAKTAGFCFGVKRAVQLAFDTTPQDGTYTLGAIIHNDVVIKRLEDKGICAIDTIQEAPVQKLIIRAHGVGKAIYDASKEKDITLIDATCPYVRKIHRLVAKHSQEGYHIIVVGDANHPEIIGINGWADNACIILKNAQEVTDYVFDEQAKYLLVSQTTYKKEVVLETYEALKAKGISVAYIPTICDATSERQEEAALIASDVDVMFVIGSAFSSNTQKLYEICSNHCSKTQCILDVTQIDKSLLKDAKKIGITAGASTPGDIIEAVINTLNNCF